MQESNTLQKLFGINSEYPLKEIDIYILLDKDRMTRNYLKEIMFQGDKLQTPKDFNGLLGDYACLITTHSKIAADYSVYSKRYSGILNTLRKYIETGLVYATKENYKTETKGLMIPDNKTAYCNFITNDMLVKIIPHNEETKKEMDLKVSEELDKLVYLSQTKSNQLVTIECMANGETKWSNNTNANISETLAYINRVEASNRYIDAMYDLNSQDYYFQFTEDNPLAPSGVYTSLVVTGKASDRETLAQLIRICNRIEKSKNNNKVETLKTL